jgi:hypothetical protein
MNYIYQQELHHFVIELHLMLHCNKCRYVMKDRVKTKHKTEAHECTQLLTLGGFPILIMQITIDNKTIIYCNNYNITLTYMCVIGKPEHRVTNII